MTSAAILYPIAAMALLVSVIMVLMLRERLTEMKARRIPPGQVASSTQMGAVLKNTRAADNYRNLFEMPVFFYALCLALYMTQRVDIGFVVGAWLFVALRVVHSAIHVGYNNVWHRFWVFAASSTLLVLMWVAFAVLQWRQA